MQRDIRYLNFVALRDAGYRGAIFDKDNCLVSSCSYFYRILASNGAVLPCQTLPDNDKLIPELEVRLPNFLTNVITSHRTFVQAAWSEALRTFGPSRVLIVSNSAGTRDDAAQLQAESVSHHLRAPVLLHAALKPSYTCASAALAALPGLAPHELIVVGDRVFTDVVLAHRLSHSRTLASRIAARLRLAPAQDSAPDDAGSSEIPGGKSPRAPLAVWTTGVWKRESVGMRWAEAQLVRLIERHVEGTRERRDALEERFVRRALDSGNRAGKADDRGWFSWVKGYLPRFG